MVQEGYSINRGATPLGSYLLSAYGTAALLMAGVQVLIDSSLVNLAAALCIVLSSIATAWYISSARAFDVEPVATFSLIGLSITTQWGALIFKTIELDSLTAGLSNGVTTIGMLCCVQCVAILAHAAYLRLNYFVPMQEVPKAILYRLGFYEELSPKVLWAMGALGCVSILMGGGGDEVDVDAKIWIGLRYYAWAPFLLPVYTLAAGRERALRGSSIFALFVYAAVLMVLGVLKNARVLMFNGITVMGLSFFLMGLMSRKPVTQRIKRGAVIGVLIAGVAISVVANLATAMVIVRADKTNMSLLETLSETAGILFDGRTLAIYKENNRGGNNWADYDERYIDNPILARFAETKFHDNSITLAKELNEQDAMALKDVTIDQVIALLPEPLIAAAGLPVQKWDLQFTFGDYLLYLAKGYGLGGYRTGSIYVQLILLFGILSPVVLFLLLLFKMAMLGLLWATGPDGRVKFSAVYLLSLWTIFISAYSADSISQFISTLTRQPIQTFLLFMPILAIPAIFRRNRYVSA